MSGTVQAPIVDFNHLAAQIIDAQKAFDQDAGADVSYDNLVRNDFNALLTVWDHSHPAQGAAPTARLSGSNSAADVVGRWLSGIGGTGRIQATEPMTSTMVREMIEREEPISHSQLAPYNAFILQLKRQLATEEEKERLQQGNYDLFIEFMVRLDNAMKAESKEAEDSAAVQEMLTIGVCLLTAYNFPGAALLFIGAYTISKLAATDPDSLVFSGS